MAQEGLDKRGPRPRGLPGAGLGLEGADPRPHHRARSGAWAAPWTGAARPSPWTRRATAPSPRPSCALRDKGLIYRDVYLVNWCPHDLTAISDDEVEYQEVQGHLWHLRYPFADGDGPRDGGHHPARDHVRGHGRGRASVRPGAQPPDRPAGEAAADRPGDPDHRRPPRRPGEGHRVREDHARPRSQRLRGGPAPRPAPGDLHDAGRRDERAGRRASRGSTAASAAGSAVAALEAAGLLDKVEKHVHQVGHHDRCGTVIEPYLSRQWFLRMEQLAEPAVAAVDDGRDHASIPSAGSASTTTGCATSATGASAASCGGGTASRSGTATTAAGDRRDRRRPTACPACGGASSGPGPRRAGHLVLAAGCGPSRPWAGPSETADLERFHPTTCWSPAPDIIFFWVARMIMASYEFLGEKPVRRGALHRHRARRRGPQDEQVAGQQPRSHRPDRQVRRRRPALQPGHADAHRRRTSSSTSRPSRWGATSATRSSRPPSWCSASGTRRGCRRRSADRRRRRGPWTCDAVADAAAWESAPGGQLRGALARRLRRRSPGRAGRRATCAWRTAGSWSRLLQTACRRATQPGEAAPERRGLRGLQLLPPRVLRLVPGGDQAAPARRGRTRGRALRWRCSTWGSPTSCCIR